MNLLLWKWGLQDKRKNCRVYSTPRQVSAALLGTKTNWGDKENDAFIHRIGLLRCALYFTYVSHNAEAHNKCLVTFHWIDLIGVKLVMQSNLSWFETKLSSTVALEGRRMLLSWLVLAFPLFQPHSLKSPSGCVVNNLESRAVVVSEYLNLLSARKIPLHFDLHRTVTTRASAYTI